MKSHFSVSLISLSILVLLSFKTNAQVYAQPMPVTEIGCPWKTSELIEPATLAGMLQSGNEKTTIFNIGVVEDLRGAIHIGGVSNKQNMV